MDLVYPVAPAPRNEELRYSLRSAVANLPHDRVWLVGRGARGFEGVGRLTPDEQRSKFTNLPHAILAAACEPEISDRFVLMNDDFFVLAPTDLTPAHRGPLPRGRNSYFQGFVQTERVLREMGVAGPLVNYELHLPLVVDKADLRSALATALTLRRGVLHTRTLYGNLLAIGGQERDDVKHFGTEAPRIADFMSTNSASFAGPAGDYLRSRFTEPSIYERG